MPDVQQSTWDDDDAATLDYPGSSRFATRPAHRVGPPPVPRPAPASERLLLISASAWQAQQASSFLGDFKGPEGSMRSASNSSRVWVCIAVACLLAAAWVIRDSMNIASEPLAIEQELAMPRPEAGEGPAPIPAVSDSAPSPERLSTSSVRSGAVRAAGVRSEQAPARVVASKLGARRVHLEHGGSYRAPPEPSVPRAASEPANATGAATTITAGAANANGAATATGAPNVTGTNANTTGTNANTTGIGAASEQGALRINSLPWSEIFVDGRAVGTTPQLNIPLDPGRHEIKLVNSELGMQRGFYVDISAGKTLTKSVVFDQP